MSNIIKQESSFSPQKERRKLSVQEVRIDHSHLLQAEENPEALMARVKEEADRISEQANSHIENIRRQIEQEKNDWAAEKQKLIEEAKAEGFEQGVALGKAETLQQYGELIDQANSIIEMSRKAVEDKLENANEEIVELAVALAKKVWQQKSDDKEAFLLLVKQVINEVKEYDDISIYVDPYYYETVFQQKDEIQQLLYKECRLGIYADEKAPKGSCYIETPFGRVDASVDTQLMQLKDKLLTALEAGAAE
ncbi:flagellar assembly protein FliH [Bacillus spizizenii ATCC 6633 = JCM 2499]|uniref:Flagellar assembly protein FliH n=1 Tax=Bacillus spizizenii (strain ATCC 23059 / NRRL B-14472 / W23) TaxID=655816 RepID=E0TUB1_BACSH|nr:flagellar assembly protein FliH [Bacillus spizizenii]QCJ16930.1 flagellar assembly protein FliH [Bacillus subtilis]ADM37718.1 flagellar export apparatus component [Bacillus spizizenii str. W23]AJW87077.1 flagellar assembly protein FliH [Bacillus spizizenii]EFG92716.1 flagellar assembly protein H [Bacillus spizizenii ATCC 6633 = JCM 2499]KFK79631.1 flagellar assembly protein FliH [Bacillus spizizenii]